MRKIKIKRKFYSGIAIAEAMIGVVIVGTTIIAFLSVLSKMFYVEFNKRDYIIATNLAQEGIEIVRNFRDNNWKANPPKEAFADPFPVTGRCYRIDFNFRYASPSSGIQTCTCGDNSCFSTKLGRDENNFYEYGGGSPTPFSRKIQIRTNGQGREIISTVRFTPKGSSTHQEIVVSDIIYPWGNTE